jgi:hypothetical protein
VIDPDTLDAIRQKRELESTLSSLSEDIGPRERRYFHLNSVANLVYHFLEIREETDRIWVFDSLSQYLRDCREMLPGIDRDASKRLYDQSLEKLVEFYHLQLGFRLLMNRSVVYTFYAILLVLCYIFLNLYAVIALTTWFGYLTFMTFRRYRDRRVYSIFW